MNVERNLTLYLPSSGSKKSHIKLGVVLRAGNKGDEETPYTCKQDSVYQVHVISECDQNNYMHLQTGQTGILPTLTCWTYHRMQ